MSCPPLLYVCATRNGNSSVYANVAVVTTVQRKPLLVTVTVLAREVMQSPSFVCMSVRPSIFTARRYAKRGICRRRVSVRLCVCVCMSVTLPVCIKTAKRRLTQTTPHDSPVTLVF